MLYSGISWNGTGYGVETVDQDGRPVAAPLRFAPGRTDEMIIQLREAGRDHVAVVDSTNGILDGRMMAAGIGVYRADPGLLPERPLFGSVPAVELARAAQRDLSALTRLERRRGTQTGRETGIEADIAASAAETDALTAAGRCWSHGDRGARQVALTFDDGPLAPYTGQVLDALDRYGVTATFFCVGMNARVHAEEIAQMRERGHAVGNHTWSHPFLTELSRPQLAAQIARAGEAIAETPGGAGPGLFRPPYGSRTPEVVGWLAELVPAVVLWDVAPDDWTMPGAETIARLVLDQVRPGSIVLLHDGGGDRSQTVAALPAIIDGLLARGYGFTSVDGLIAAARPGRAGGAH